MSLHAPIISLRHLAHNISVLKQTLVNHCIEKNVPVFPGCVNASDMTRAVNAGLKVVKFFPAEQSGGVAFLKALALVLPLNIMLTGGVNTKNLKDLIEGEKRDEITAICKDAVKTMLGFELAHIGVNCADEGEAERTAKTLCALFGFEYKAGSSSIFAGKAVECMKKPGRGTHGHIAIATNSVDRAVYHLGRQGVEFLEDSRVADAKGKTKAIYVKD